MEILLYQNAALNQDTVGRTPWSASSRCVEGRRGRRPRTGGPPHLMDAINSLMGAVLRGYLAALAWAPPVTGLILISLLAGVGMLWVFKKTSDPRRIRAVKRLQ